MSRPRSPALPVVLTALLWCVPLCTPGNTNAAKPLGNDSAPARSDISAHSQLATRNSQLATRNSQLATTFSQLTPPSSHLAIRPVQRTRHNAQRTTHNTQRSAAPSYTAQPIALPKSKLSGAVGLNDQGQAILWTSRCISCTRTYYFWSSGTATVIGMPAGATDFEPVATGPSGTYAASALFGSGPDTTIRAFRGSVDNTQAQSFTPLADPSNHLDGLDAVAMDSAGDILGESTGDPAQFYEWPAGQDTATLLNPSAPAGDSITLTALDDSGDQAGVITGPKGSQLAVWPAGSSSPDILDHSFVSNSSAAGPPAIGGIVRSGETIYVTGYQAPVGYAKTVGYLWTIVLPPGPPATSPVKIKTINGSRPAVITSGVSPSGVVVGADWSPTHTVAVVVVKGHEYALKSLVTGPTVPPASAFAAIPAGINASGQILLGGWILTPKG